MKRSRDYRRYRKHLKKKKAEKVLREVWKYSERSITSRQIGRHADNLKICSCQMCRNIRSSNFYNSFERLTLQERRELLNEAVLND